MIFDTNYYNEKNPDVAASYGSSSIQHYLDFGIKEGRIFRFLGKGYLKAELNPTLGSGLCNQMWSIVISMLFGKYLGREVVIEHFYPEYNKKIEVPLSSVINTRKLLISSSQRKWKNANLIDPLRSHKMFTDAIKVLIQDNNECIDIKDVFTVYLFDSFEENLKREIEYLFTLIEFNPSFHIIANKYKEILGISQYTAIHLRLEDDMMWHWDEQKRKRIENEYIYKIKEADSCSKLYISTGLLKYENKKNPLLLALCKLHPNLVVSTLELWNEHVTQKLPIKGREMDAIIDFILCCQSMYFIGVYDSTFSRLIALNLNEKGFVSHVML